MPHECDFAANNIGVAPIRQVTHMRNKNSNIQGSSLNVIKEIFYTILGTAYKGKNSIRSLREGGGILHLREVSILKRDAIEDNHCLIQ